MPIIEQLILTCATGYVGFRVINHLLLKEFFQGTQKRMKIMTEQSDLLRNLQISNNIKNTQPQKLRVLYSKQGRQWHSPLITQRDVPEIVQSEVIGEGMMNCRGSKGYKVRESLDEVFRRSRVEEVIGDHGDINHTLDQLAPLIQEYLVRNTRIS